MPDAPRPTPPPAVDDGTRVVRPLVMGTVVAALFATLAAGASVWAADVVTWSVLLAAAAFAGAIVLVQNAAIPFDWRGRRLVVSLDESILFLAFATSPPALVVPAVLAGATVAQVIARRRPLKGAFNVSASTLAAGVGVLAFHGATLLGAPVVIAAFPAVAAHTLASNLLVAWLFARLERGGFLRVAFQRFALPALLQVALGACIGVAMWGLWLHHPAASLAVLPFAFLAKGYVDLTARADRELRVHRALAESSSKLASDPGVDPAVQHLLDACGLLFQPAEATVVLRAPGRPERQWTRRFDEVPGAAWNALTAPIPGEGGAPMGEILLRPRARQAYGEVERELLRIVAGQASTAILIAIALEDNREMRNLHAGIVQHVPAGVVRIDGQARILQVNEYLVRALQGERDGEALVARSIHDWSALPPDPLLRERIEGVLHGRPFGDVELEAGAERRVFAVSGVPLPGSEEEPCPGGVLMFHDVTARKVAEAALKRQTLTRPLVRRIVLDLVGSASASRATIAEAGRNLAREVPAERIEQYVEAFREMGLGELQLVSSDAETYSFKADDLLERRPKSSQPTCHLALGYLEGAVALLHGKSSLGSEVRCQSQGHERCSFVVKPREAPMPLVRARRPVDQTKFAPKIQTPSAVKNTMK